jgi:hypothetical protein
MRGLTIDAATWGRRTDGLLDRIDRNPLTARANIVTSVAEVAAAKKKPRLLTGAELGRRNPVIEP